MPSEAANQRGFLLVGAHSQAEGNQMREAGRRMLALELRTMEEEHRSQAEDFRMLELGLHRMEVVRRSRQAAADSWGTFAQGANS